MVSYSSLLQQLSTYEWTCWLLFVGFSHPLLWKGNFAQKLERKRGGSKILFIYFDFLIWITSNERTLDLYTPHILINIPRVDKAICKKEWSESYSFICDDGSKIFFFLRNSSKKNLQNSAQNVGVRFKRKKKQRCKKKISLCFEGTHPLSMIYK